MSMSLNAMMTKSEQDLFTPKVPGCYKTHCNKSTKGISFRIMTTFY